MLKDQYILYISQNLVIFSQYYCHLFKTYCQTDVVY